MEHNNNQSTKNMQFSPTKINGGIYKSEGLSIYDIKANEDNFGSIESTLATHLIINTDNDHQMLMNYMYVYNSIKVVSVEDRVLKDYMYNKIIFTINNNNRFC